MTDLQFGLGAACTGLLGAGAVLGFRRHQKQELKLGGLDGLALILFGMLWYVGALAMHANALAVNAAAGRQFSYANFAFGSLLVSFISVSALSVIWALIFRFLKRVAGAIRRLQTRWELRQAVR